MSRRRMAPEDGFWLGLDRPDNLMVVTSLMWTTEQVDPDRLRSVIRDRLLDRFPVFMQRPDMRGGVLRSGWWVDDEDFDLDRHVVVLPAPGGGDRAGLQDFVGSQRATPLDPAHPMWRIHLLQGYQGGSAVVIRFHHSMADGIRSTQVMLDLLDPLEGDEPQLAARVGRPGPVHPGRTVGTGLISLANTAGSLVKLALWTNPPSGLEGRPGVDKAVTWTEPVPLAVLKEIGHRCQATVNDVCTALVCGAMARYLDEASGPPLTPGDDDVAWMVPVNLEPPDQRPPPELGNHFALVLLVLPHGSATFGDRLAEVHRRMARIRDSWEPTLTFGLSRAIALSPTPLAAALTGFFAPKAVGVLTNVPGPRTPMALAGAPVAGVVGWAPTSMRQGLTVTIFSYAGGVTFGFGTDCAVVHGPELLVRAFDEQLAEAVLLTDAGDPAETPATEDRDRLPSP